ncbi:hypothetical protein Tco_0441158 [Tanacetum coccineum]
MGPKESVVCQMNEQSENSQRNTRRLDELQCLDAPRKKTPLSSSKRTSDCERDVSALGRLIGAKGDLPEKDLRSAIQIDNHKEVKYRSRNMN